MYLLDFAHVLLYYIQPKSVITYATIRLIYLLLLCSIVLFINNTRADCIICEWSTYKKIDSSKPASHEILFSVFFQNENKAKEKVKIHQNNGEWLESNGHQKPRAPPAVRAQVGAVFKPS